MSATKSTTQLSAPKESLSQKMKHDAEFKILPYLVKQLAKTHGMLSPSVREIATKFNKSHSWAQLCLDYLIAQKKIAKDPKRKQRNIIIK